MAGNPFPAARHISAGTAASLRKGDPLLPAETKVCRQHLLPFVFISSKQAAHFSLCREGNAAQQSTASPQQPAFRAAVICGKPPETGCSRYAANRFSKYSIPNRVSRKVQSFAWERSCSFRLSYSSRRNCPSASVRSAASESVFKWLTEGISPPAQRKSCRRNCASNILLYA